MIEFTDILLGSTLPLHPYLTEHPYLSIRLIVDETICGETPPVNGDLTSGIWDINSSLRADSAEQSVTLAVIANKKGLRIRFASVKLSVVELFTRTSARSSGYQEFTIVDSSSSIQFLMTCMVKASPSFMVDNPSPSAIVHSDRASDRRGGEAQRNDSKPPSRADLESFYAKAIRLPDGNDDKARALSALGRTYYALYEEERRRADLDKAISLHEEAMQFTGPVHPQMALHASSLAIALMKRFQQSGDSVDIERAISQFQTALEFTEDTDEDKLGRLSNLGIAHRLRFERLGELADLENSISCQRQAIELTSSGHRSEPALLNNLGTALQYRYERLGGPEDLEDAISGLRKAVDLTPNGHPDRPSLLNNLGSALQSRFERLGGLSDIEDAISSLREAVNLTPDGHPGKPSRLNNLGNAHQSRFERLSSPVDLEDAILAHRKAVDLTPDRHPDKPNQLNNLGGALQSRFRRLDSIVDLEDAISAHRKAVDLTPDDHPDKPSQLDNLGGALQYRFERLGRLSDTEDAILSLRRAVNLTPDGHPGKPSRLNNLGKVHQSRFERLGSLVDLEDAISAHRKAVNLTPNVHPDKPSQLNYLCGALQSRFERLGDLADLEDAIWNEHNAVDLSPDGHPDKPSLFNNLANAFQCRFERIGEPADLEYAISGLRKAVDLTPNGHPDRPSLLNNLGSALQYRFERFGNLADLEDAISNEQKAVELTPDGHPDKPSRHINLGGAPQSRFGRPGGLADIEDAISGFRQAVEVTPDGHPDKPSPPTNVEIALRSLFGDLNGLADTGNDDGGHVFNEISAGGRFARLMIHGRMSSTNRIWIDQQATFGDVSTELATIDSTVEFVVLQPMWGPKPRWARATPELPLGRTCRIIHAIFNNQAGRCIMGVVRTSLSDNPIAIFESEASSTTFFQALESHPDLPGKIKSITRYSDDKDVGDDQIDYEDLAGYSSSTFSTAIIVTIDCPTDEFKSDPPDQPLPTFLQVPLMHCTRLLKRSYDLKRFALQTIHLLHALLHIIISLANQLEPIVNDENPDIEAALSADDDMADILRIAPFISRDIQGFLDMEDETMDAIDSESLTGDEVQRAVREAFNAICGDYPGAVTVRHSYKRFEMFALIDREEAAGAHDGPNNMGSKIIHTDIQTGYDAGSEARH